MIGSISGVYLVVRIELLVKITSEQRLEGNRGFYHVYSWRIEAQDKQHMNMHMCSVK